LNSRHLTTPGTEGSRDWPGPSAQSRQPPPHRACRPRPGRHTAAAATRHLTEEDWTRVVAGGGDGRRLFLVAEVAGDETLVVTIADDQVVGGHLGRGALAVDLTGVAEAALTRLNALLAVP